MRREVEGMEMRNSKSKWKLLKGEELGPSQSNVPKRRVAFCSFSVMKTYLRKYTTITLPGYDEEIL
jgi:hypothetical protein